MTVAILGALLAATGAAARPRMDGAAALEQLRTCVGERRDVAVSACRQALALGLGAQRAALARDMLARQLVLVERWDEALEVRAEAAAQQPLDAAAQMRWGEALLFYAGRPAEALVSFDAAVALRPEEARAHGLRGLALNALGRFAESLSAFEEASRLEPSWIERRPSTSRVLEASRQGQRWP